jgi:hypothetical protein
VPLAKQATVRQRELQTLARPRGRSPLRPIGRRPCGQGTRAYDAWMAPLESRSVSVVPEME